MKIQNGFALPTVMISSVVMLIVLLASLVAASSANTLIRQQYYDKLLKEAAEAGVAMANACLMKNGYAVTWSNGSPLRPNTDCDGTTLDSTDLPSQNIPSLYLAEIPNSTNPTIRVSFTVPAPVTDNGVTRVNASGQLLRYRTSTSVQMGSTETFTTSGLVGGQNSFQNVAFGYGGGGAQFAVVLPTGEVKAVGENTNGRLGNGNFTDSLTPANFILPGGESGIGAYTNFLSLGLNLYVITQNGKAYGAGGNGSGQLGNSTTAATESTPRQFGTLGNGSNPKARFVAALADSTFVIASDNRIYAAGACLNGQLGINDATCSGTGGIRSTPVQVANLPTPGTDPNTQPETSPGWVQPTNMNADRYNIFVRMKGGAVYGWGLNDWGQLATGNTTQQNQAVKIRAIDTNIGMQDPYMTQIAFNGTAFYGLDIDGRVWASGSNEVGEQLGAGALLRSSEGDSHCARKNNANGNILMATCATNDGWQMVEWWPDGSLRWRDNSYTYDPTDLTYCATATSTSAVSFQTCNTSTAPAANQRWTFGNDKKIQSVSNGNCIYYNNAGGSGEQLGLASCGSSFTTWQTQNSPYLQPVPRPYNSTIGSYRKYTKISTDNRATLLLDEDGKVWAAGGNNRGQIGIGSRTTFEPVLKQVQLPTTDGSGNAIRAVDIYMTEANPYLTADGTNGASYNNAYFIMSNGWVYGAGANNYGQIGNGTTSEAVTTPTRMTTLPTGTYASTVQAGRGTAVIITSGGKIYTVGNNDSGQLGDGTTTPSSTAKANTYTNLRTTLVY